MRPPPTLLASLALLPTLVLSSPVEADVTARALEKRFSNARLIFFNAALGACGRASLASDFVRHSSSYSLPPPGIYINTNVRHQRW